MSDIKELKDFYISNWGNEKMVTNCDRVFYKLLSAKEYQFIFSVWEKDWCYISKRVSLIKSFVTGETRGEDCSPAPNKLADKLITEVAVRLYRTAFGLKVEKPINRCFWDSEEISVKESVRTMHLLVDIAINLQSNFLQYLFVKRMIEKFGRLPPSVYGRVSEIVDFFRGISKRV